ncbi:MCE family protein [Gordonia hydrophobica]|uniref:MlaD family protein n=1 Tax=Gordonia hydrophobica TaxID=40516 RepID=A0ABZ2TXE8_9ACTN|nr:MlaD family protein [Gordonia hydrophobica]MBM7366233.1 phospholipid/cholesterol/gamma-HCH transport system substrate-binding protein [Gordonia hydrophobica]
MPPLSRLVKTQLAVVLVLGLVASLYAGVRYARMDQALGISGYRVVVHMDSSGGIFPGAQVTYRGVAAGRVSDMTLVPGGVDVELTLESGRADIPASVVAVIANRSAIGEQFLDLQPKSDVGPFLRDGSEISTVELPPAIQDVIASTIDLTKTVPVDSLRTVVQELGRAFNGKGQDLSTLVDSLDTLSDEGLRSLDDTIELITNSNVVLGTQADQSDEILRWSRDLDRLTAQLASSDPAIRRILREGPRAASALSNFLDDNGADATTLIGQLGETARTAAPASYATGMTFAMLSVLAASSHSTASPDGSIRFGIVLETGNPPSCTRGYESTQTMIDDIKRKNPDFDINYDDFPFNTDASCEAPVGSPTGVRGGPRAALGNPDVAQPWDNTPKKDADRLDLNPLATQLAALMGVRPAR